MSKLRSSFPALPRGAVTLGVLLLVACERQAQRDTPAVQGQPATSARAPAALDYTPPPDSLIPHDQRGESIRRGLALVTHTTDSLPDHAPGGVQCVSCHIDAGRRRGAASWIGVHARYPRYVERSDKMILIEDRVNQCFIRSLSGTGLIADSREMRDIVAYLAYLSDGVPVGRHVVGEGMPTMPKLAGDTLRGAALFRSTCAVCHGTNGNGNGNVIPALWGARSYSIGASMGREERAASFIRHFMPLSNPGSLTDQQAYDVAAYVNAQPRPDTPGKNADWSQGGAPADVPYDLTGHRAYRPPAKLLPRLNDVGMRVQLPSSSGHPVPARHAPAR
jgi:thiosulfate dehydrogenase